MVHTQKEAALLQRLNNFRAADKSSVDEGVPAPSPAAIAASVKRTAKHQALAEEIERLSGERETVIAKMRELIAEFAGGANDSAIRKLAKRREKLEQALQPLRTEIRHHCDNHAAALNPVRRDAARRFLRLSAELSAAAQYINDCETAIDAAGGQVSYNRIQTNYGHAELRARQLAGLENGQ
jgi:uncharacterized protein (UPF0335 family)